MNHENQKPWRPTIVDPGARHLHMSYGITEARRIELCDQMADLCLRLYAQDITIEKLVDDLAELAKNAAEFAWCLMTITIGFERNGLISCHHET